MMLSSAQIRDRIFDHDKLNRLYVTPLLNLDEQITDSTIDLRLASEFLIPKRNDAHLFDPMDRDKMTAARNNSERVYISPGEKLFLHPGKVILGGTVEYIRLPLDLAGRIRARSSYERIGLSLSTLANPGYRGSLTITLVNLGNTPIVLYPGTRLAQMTIYQIETRKDGSDKAYGGKYFHEIGPVFSKAYADPDLDILKRMATSAPKR